MIQVTSKRLPSAKVALGALAIALAVIGCSDTYTCQSLRITKKFVITHQVIERKWGAIGEYGRRMCSVELVTYNKYVFVSDYRFSYPMEDEYEIAVVGSSFFKGMWCDMTACDDPEVRARLSSERETKPESTPKL